MHIENIGGMFRVGFLGCNLGVKIKRLYDEVARE